MNVVQTAYCPKNTLKTQDWIYLDAFSAEKIIQISSLLWLLFYINFLFPQSRLHNAVNTDNSGQNLFHVLSAKVAKKYKSSPFKEQESEEEARGFACSANKLAQHVWQVLCC